MSVSDDYPKLRALAYEGVTHGYDATRQELRGALEELERLRARSVRRRGVAGGGDIYKDVTRLTHRYGLQEVYAIVKARYEQMNRNVRDFVESLGPDATKAGPEGPA